MEYRNGFVNEEHLSNRINGHMGRSGMQHCSFYSREQDILLFPIIFTYRFCLMLQLCSRNTCNYSDYLFQTQHPKLKIFLKAVKNRKKKSSWAAKSINSREHPLSKVPGQVVEDSSWSLSSTLQQLNLSFPNNVFREWHWKWCVPQVLEHAGCLKMHTPHWHCWRILYLYVCAHSHTRMIPGASHPQNYSWILLQNSTIVHTRYKNSNWDEVNQQGKLFDNANRAFWTAPSVAKFLSLSQNVISSIPLHKKGMGEWSTVARP